MDHGRLPGQEDKLYVVIAYADDMQIFICNRNVFLLRLSQKYGIPMEHIGFYDFELESSSPMVDLKDIRDGMILKMVDKSQLPPTSVTGEAAYIPAYLLPYKNEAKINGTSVLGSREVNVSRCYVFSAKEVNRTEPSVPCPKEETSEKVEVGTKRAMPSTSGANGGAPRFKRVKITLKSGVDVPPNVPKLQMKKIVFLKGNTF